MSKIYLLILNNFFVINSLFNFVLSLQLQDPNRLHYDPLELRMFENIECEWPLFFCYLILSYIFQGNKETALDYLEKLEQVISQRPSQCF